MIAKKKISKSTVISARPNLLRSIDKRGNMIQSLSTSNRDWIIESTPYAASYSLSLIRVLFGRERRKIFKICLTWEGWGGGGWILVAIIFCLRVFYHMVEGPKFDGVVFSTVRFIWP